MILVDTSVWIEFFRGNEPYKTELQKLIEQNNVITSEVIFGELLQGAKNKREREVLEAYWNNLKSISLDGLWVKAGKRSSEKKLTSKGIGLIDCVLIESAEKSMSKIWTLDKKLRNSITKTLNYT